MSDHLVLCADRLITPESLQSMEGDKEPVDSGECSSSHTADEQTCFIDVERVGEHDVSEEEKPLIQTMECRICQEEDSINNLESPCACSGSLKVLIFAVYFFSINENWEYLGSLHIHLASSSPFSASFVSLCQCYRYSNLFSNLVNACKHGETCFQI